MRVRLFPRTCGSLFLRLALSLSAASPLPSFLNCSTCWRIACEDFSDAVLISRRVSLGPLGFSGLAGIVSSRSGSSAGRRDPPPKAVHIAVAASELRQCTRAVHSPLFPLVQKNVEKVPRPYRGRRAPKNRRASAPWARANRSLLGARRRRLEDSRAAPPGVPGRIEVRFPASMCRWRPADRSVAVRGSPVKPRARSAHRLASCWLHRQRLRSPRAGGGSTTRQRLPPQHGTGQHRRGLPGRVPAGQVGELMREYGFLLCGADNRQKIGWVAREPGRASGTRPASEANSRSASESRVAGPVDSQSTARDFECSHRTAACSATRRQPVTRGPRPCVPERRASRFPRRSPATRCELALRSAATCRQQ